MGRANWVKRFFSIHIRLNPAWYPAVLLFAWILVTGFPGEIALWKRMLLGLLGSVIFLASMYLIQFIKNAISMAFRIPTKNVVLFVFGDSTHVPEDETSPRIELLRAVITISLTLITAAVFQWFYTYWSRASYSPGVLILQWLAFFWYMLAVLHLVPAFPLANGRVLSTLVWKVTGNYLRAVLMATRLGWLFGSSLLLWGLYLLFVSGQTTNGLLLIFFGWFLQGAASFSSRRAVLLDSLKYARARDVFHYSLRPFAKAIIF